MRHYTKYILIVAFLLISGCGDNKITFIEPNGATVWMRSDGLHKVEWRDSKSRMPMNSHATLSLFRGDKKIRSLDIYMSDDGEVVVRHPLVPKGTDYRLKFEAGDEFVGFSEPFTIK